MVCTQYTPKAAEEKFCFFSDGILMFAANTNLCQAILSGGRVFSHVIRIDIFILIQLTNNHLYVHCHNPPKSHCGCLMIGFEMINCGILWVIVESTISIRS